MSQELEEKRKLADHKVADAKSAPLKEDKAPKKSYAKGIAMTWRINILLVMSLILLGSSWYISTVVHRTQQRTTAVHLPVTLIDEVEHFPAPAGKAIPLSLSYGGTVNIDIQVVRGNPVDVFLTTPDQLDTLSKGEWYNLKVYGDFGATQTKTYRRAVHLAQGGYYLVVRDMSVGVPTSLPSDISVKVQLHP